MFFTSFIFLLIFAMLTLFWVIWNNRLFFFFKREKSSSFECGFDPKDSSRLPFSLRFFNILILFLVFDVELVLILQLPLLNFDLTKNFLSLFVFFLFLLFGLFEEWRRSLLNWKD